MVRTGWTDRQTLVVKGGGNEHSRTYLAGVFSQTESRGRSVLSGQGGDSDQHVRMGRRLAAVKSSRS